MHWQSPRERKEIVSVWFSCVLHVDFTCVLFSVPIIWSLTKISFYIVLKYMLSLSFYLTHYVTLICWMLLLLWGFWFIVYTERICIFLQSYVEGGIRIHDVFFQNLVFERMSMLVSFKGEQMPVVGTQGATFLVRKIPDPSPEYGFSLALFPLLYIICLLCLLFDSMILCICIV